MTDTPLNRLGAAEAASAIAAGRITSQALVRACLDRIAAREAEIGAWTSLEPDRALDAARRCDSARDRGPLHGVPVGIKDIIDTADLPTGYGSRIYEGHRPAWDAACVALIRRAGGIVLGKTVSTEFAYFSPGKTANPRNPRHTPGGSSSGSAAAVADAMVPAALGTQTAASVIRPAAYCGIVGFKPSFGVLPLAGIKPFAPSFDTLGTMTRSVADARLMWSVLNGVAPAAGGSVRAPRIGVCRTPQWPAAEAATREALDAAARAFAAGGARVAEMDLPSVFDDLAEVHKGIMAFEAARAYAHEYATRRRDLSARLTELIEAGLALPWDGYLALRRRMEEAKRAFAEVMAGWDALLAPAAPGEAPEGLDATGDPVFSRMWTLLQVPCLTLPVLSGPAGLPVGIQLVGTALADGKLLDIGEWASERLAARR